MALVISTCDLQHDYDQRVVTNVDTYRDHLNDLQRLLDQSLMDQVEFDRLKLELDHNLLTDNQQGYAFDRTRHVPIVYCVLLLYPVCCRLRLSIFG